MQADLGSLAAEARCGQSEGQSHEDWLSRRLVAIRQFQAAAGGSFEGEWGPEWGYCHPGGGYCADSHASIDAWAELAAVSTGGPALD